MRFDDEVTDVLIGGYLSKDAAREDYEAVLACGGSLHGAVVVSRDLQGNLSVEQTGHMVCEGAAGLGAIADVQQKMAANRHLTFDGRLSGNLARGRGGQDQDAFGRARREGRTWSLTSC